MPTCLICFREVHEVNQFRADGQLIGPSCLTCYLNYMPTFNDAENKLMFQPPGDYIFTVIGHEKKLVSSGASAGADMDALYLEIIGVKKATSTLFDNLIDTAKAGWKYDVLLKSAGVKVTKGQSFTLTDDAAVGPFINADGQINPLGLRGWCMIGEDTYNGKKKNIIACYYTDRAKLAPVKIEPEPGTDDAAFGQQPPPAPVAGDEPQPRDDIPF